MFYVLDIYHIKCVLYVLDCFRCVLLFFGFEIVLSDI